MTMITRFFMYLSIIALLIVSILVPVIFNFQQPQLPQTKLAVIDLSGFQRSARVLMADSINEPANIELSPRQVSYLVQQNRPDNERYGFKLQDVHYEASDAAGHMQAILEGPLGLWLKIDWIGTIQLNKQGSWQVNTERLWAGRFPMHWLAPARWFPDWPTSFSNGRVKLHQARLDGNGLRARLSHNGLNIEIPGVDVDPGLLQKGVDAIKNLF